MYPTTHLWVGLGCQKGTPPHLFEQALRRVCRQHSIDWTAIAGLATLDAKRAEPGLLTFSLEQHWPLLYFTRAELEAYTVPNPSTVVNAAVGVLSVCEAAALRAADQAPSILRSTLVVPKQVFRDSSALGSVTVAIAKLRPYRCA